MFGGEFELPLLRRCRCRIVSFLGDPLRVLHFDYLVFAFGLIHDEVLILMSCLGDIDGLLFVVQEILSERLDLLGVLRP